jgi:hypothetical protein
MAFFSNTPGSGNRNQDNVILPHDPSPSDPTTKSYEFELTETLWFGMAMCDTQSYPEQMSICTPDSGSNIVDPAISPDHPGTAFIQLEFYPSGVPWPTWAVASGVGGCSATQWCVALNINSLATRSTGPN